MKQANILVTGGCGFIGSNFIRYALQHQSSWKVVNLDALTYAGNPNNLSDLKDSDRYLFVQGDIRNSDLLADLFAKFKFDGVFHFAAESHVDRSIFEPEAFVETNIMGTCSLLKAGLDFWKDRENESKFRFLHISTDEVYGSLGVTDQPFTEESPYRPSSPYAASKASSDHLVRSFHITYGLPVIITNCSNNFGPYQFPEKLIPLMIMNIANNEKLPLYGDGLNTRDWLYVLDHCDALMSVFLKGKVGETYNIGGGVEKQNIEIVNTLCDILDERLKRKKSSRDLVRFVKDRPGHDLRYAIDSSKVELELGWKAKFDFEHALLNTIDWYLKNQQWVESVEDGSYRNWIVKNYIKR